MSMSMSMRMTKRLRFLLVPLVVSAAALAGAGVGRAAAPAGRYVIGEGTVYDTRTNLTWQRVVPAAMYDQADAASYCAALGLGGSVWRLPTMREILTIMDLSVGPPGPTIDATAFPDTPAGFFWSGTQYSGTPGSAWSAQFYYGFAYGNMVTDTSYVRCMHQGQPTGPGQ
jgi:hypothetical protein